APGPRSRRRGAPRDRPDLVARGPVPTGSARARRARPPAAAPRLPPPPPRGRAAELSAPRLGRARPRLGDRLPGRELLDERGEGDLGEGRDPDLRRDRAAPAPSLPRRLLLVRRGEPPRVRHESGRPLRGLPRADPRSRGVLLGWRHRL